jgi:hypothetical protein
LCLCEFIVTVSNLNYCCCQVILLAPRSAQRISLAAFAPYHRRQRIFERHERLTPGYRRRHRRGKCRCTRCYVAWGTLTIEPLENRVLLVFLISELSKSVFSIYNLCKYIHHYLKLVDLEGRLFVQKTDPRKEDCHFQGRYPSAFLSSYTNYIHILEQ